MCVECELVVDEIFVELLGDLCCMVLVLYVLSELQLQCLFGVVLVVCGGDLLVCIECLFVFWLQVIGWKLVLFVLLIVVISFVVQVCGYNEVDMLLVVMYVVGQVEVLLVQ